MKYRMKKAPMGWNSYDYYDTTVNEGFPPRQAEKALRRWRSTYTISD